MSSKILLFVHTGSENILLKCNPGFIKYGHLIALFRYITGWNSLLLASGNNTENRVTLEYDFSALLADMPVWDKIQLYVTSVDSAFVTVNTNGNGPYNDSITNYSSSLFYEVERGNLVFLPVPMEENGEVVVRRNVEPDNSCLFHCIIRCLCPESASPDNLRQFVKDAIISNPRKYGNDILGASSEEYCRWITNSENWGGYIEMVVFSDYFDVEFCVINVVRQYHYIVGSESNKYRVYLLYTGRHYDYIAVSPSNVDSEEFDITCFPVSSDKEIDKYVVDYVVNHVLNSNIRAKL